MDASDRNNEESDTDAILAELEAEEDKDISVLRAQKAATVSSASHANTSSSISQDNYMTLKSDDDTLQFTTEHEKAVVHFFHPDFARCGLMNDHMTAIAQKHAEYGTDAAENEVRFARVDVKHAEFVVQKLAIRVLPCVIGFIKGQIVGRIIGFEGVAWGGQEKGIVVTRAIEEQFVEWKVLRRALIKQHDDVESESDEDGQATKTGRRGITGRRQNSYDVDEDDDWD